MLGDDVRLHPLPHLLHRAAKEAVAHWPAASMVLLLRPRTAHMATRLIDEFSLQLRCSSTM